MIVDVTLDTNRLIVSEATGPEELQSLTYINIVRVLPIVREQRDFSSTADAPVLYEQWYARLIDATNTQLDIPLGNLASEPGWLNSLAGYEQAETDIYAAFPSGGGGGGGLTGITGIAGITYAGTPTSVMTVSDAPDAREALGATISHGPYQAGLVVNFHDLTYENGVVYEWLGSQFTTTGVIATDTNWSVWGAVWQQKNRTLLQLVDTDLVALTGTIDIYYLLDAAGSAEITDTGTFTAGTQFTMRTGPAATQLKFTAVGTIDGAGGSIDVLSGANLQLTSIGSGDWITTA